MTRLEIDPDSDRPVSQQLIDQLRYLIATGHYTVNDPLPSTRQLGNQLDISFHTVRKAYKTLEEEGLLSAKVGSGYTVEERTPLAKSTRIEEGAKVVQNTLKTLIGLGLSEAEIESLFKEQANLLDYAGVERKLLCVGPFPELNSMYADQLSRSLQRAVQPITLSQLDGHRDADYGFAAYPHLMQVLEHLPRGDVHGFVTHLPSPILERTARLLDREVLGLVTRYRSTISPLTDQLRDQTAYGGQVIAASLEEGVEHLPNVVEQTDLLLHTPESTRRLRPLLDEESPDHRELRVHVSPESKEAIVEAVPA
jgi:GntR family transcriptional regulator